MFWLHCQEIRGENEKTVRFTKFPLTFQRRSWSSCTVSASVVVRIRSDLRAHCYLLLMETLPYQKKLKRSQGKIVVIHHHLIHHHSWSEQLLGNVADVGILELLRTIASLHQYLCSKMIQRDSEQNEFVTSEWGVPEMGLFFGVSEGLTPLLLEPQQPIIQSQWLSCHGLLWLLSAIVFFCFAKLAPVFDSNHCNLSWRKCQT